MNGKELAQRLSHENESIRDKAWEITKKKIKEEEINTEEEMRELWIGIYFWYWHSDGKTYQQMVRDEITSLIKKDEISKEQCFQYVRSGMKILEEYWDGIDYVRMVKYEKLLCQIIQRYLYYIACYSWDVEMIKEWNEYLLKEVVTLRKQPKSLSYSVKIADYYYDYMNDVVYIDEAPEPSEESKKELAMILIRYLRSGRVESLQKSFVEAQGRLQTELYKYIGLGEYVKDVEIIPAKEYNKIPNFGVGMGRVEKMKEYRKEKRKKRDEQRRKKEMMKERRAKREEEGKEKKEEMKEMREEMKEVMKEKKKEKKEVEKGKEKRRKEIIDKKKKEKKEKKPKKNVV